MRQLTLISAFCQCSVMRRSLKHGKTALKAVFNTKKIMTEEILKKANTLKSDIDLLNLRREQIHQFYNVFKKKAPTEEELNVFCNNMIEIVDNLKQIKEDKFKEL